MKAVLQINRLIPDLKLCSCLVSFASLKPVAPSELQPWLRLFSDSPAFLFPEGLKLMAVFWPGCGLPVREGEKHCCGSRATGVVFRHLAHQKRWTKQNRIGLIKQTDLSKIFWAKYSEQKLSMAYILQTTDIAHPLANGITMERNDTESILMCCWLSTAGTGAMWNTESLQVGSQSQLAIFYYLCDVQCHAWCLYLFI